MKVMIQCVDDHSIQTTTREATQFQYCFGIQRDAQHGLISARFLVHPVKLIKDGIGLGNFLQRTAFFTRFSP
jgi:hypothetical protein